GGGGRAGGDRGPPLPGRRRRHRDGGQLAQGEELGQAQGVVLVRLALGVLELPGLAGGVGDVADQAEFVAQVVHPAGQQAGLDDGGGGPRGGEKAGGVARRGG